MHVVFTLPHQLSQLALANKRTLYDLLFRASAATLLKIAADPKHLGADIGFLSVLHTWGQNVLHHPHVHCVIPAGGLSLDHQRWIHTRYAFFLPVKVLSRVFRGKFTAGLKRAFRKGQLTFPGSLQPLENERAFWSSLRSLFRQDWIVYAKPPFGGPQHVLHYLARYTHCVAISNHRIVSFADRSSHFPLERLRPPQHTKADDNHSRGVSAPLPPPCAPARLRPHSLLWFPCPSPAQVAVAAVPTTAADA